MLLKPPSKKLVVFDLDHTLIKVNSSYCYFKTLYHRGILNLSVLLRGALLRCRYYATSITLEKMHHLVFDRILRGFSLETLEGNIDQLIEKLLPEALYLPAYQELTAAQKRGDHTVLLSSGPDFLVRKFASYFKFDMCEGTVYGLDHKRRLRNIARLIVGTQKAQTVLNLQKKLGISKDQIVVYSDSHDDIPLLQLAGEPVAVNPDRRLRGFAELHRWRVI